MCSTCIYRDGINIIRISLPRSWYSFHEFSDLFSFGTEITKNNNNNLNDISFKSFLVYNIRENLELHLKKQF